MKATSNFKMSKPTKTMLALGKFKSTDARAHFKKMMLEAELESSKKITSSKTKEQ